MSFYTMSDHYFKAARDAGCIGLHTGMTGFHACASENNCFKNGKPRKGRKRKRKEIWMTYWLQLVAEKSEEDAGAVGQVLG